MNSKKRLTPIAKLRLDPINKILKIDSSRAKKHRKEAIERHVSRIALTDLLKNTPTTVCNNLPDFRTFLAQKENVDIFREFLKSQYCQENIDFYMACERYRKLDENKVGKELIKFMANQIFNDYLSKDARQPVNVNYDCVRYIQENIKDPKPDLLSEAQAEIFNLMRTDCFPRFCKTWQLDPDTAKKILSDESGLILSTPMSNKTNESVTTSTMSSSTPATTSCCSSIKPPIARKRSHTSPREECPPECPYFKVGLPCQRHIKAYQEPKIQPKRLCNPQIDLIDQLDLRLIHHVPDQLENGLPPLPSPPPPLPPKPGQTSTNLHHGKKYQPYTGKVFYV